MNSSKLIYRVSTGLVLLLVGSSGFADLLKFEPIKESFRQLDFPEYFLPFFGVAKISASIAILLKSKKTLREWAYAGIIFYFLGAIYIHIANGDGMNKIVVPLLILAAVITSYMFSKRMLPLTVQNN